MSVTPRNPLTRRDVSLQLDLPVTDGTTPWTTPRSLTRATVAG